MAFRVKLKRDKEAEGNGFGDHMELKGGFWKDGSEEQHILRY